MCGKELDHTDPTLKNMCARATVSHAGSTRAKLCARASTIQLTLTGTHTCVAVLRDAAHPVRIRVRISYLGRYKMNGGKVLS